MVKKKKKKQGKKNKGKKYNKTQTRKKNNGRKLSLKTASSRFDEIIQNLFQEEVFQNPIGKLKQLSLDLDNSIGKSSKTEKKQLKVFKKKVDTLVNQFSILLKKNELRVSQPVSEDVYRYVIEVLYQKFLHFLEKLLDKNFLRNSNFVDDQLSLMAIFFKVYQPWLENARVAFHGSHRLTSALKMIEDKELNFKDDEFLSLISNLSGQEENSVEFTKVWLINEMLRKYYNDWMNDSKGLFKPNENFINGLVALFWGNNKIKEIYSLDSIEIPTNSIDLKTDINGINKTQVSCVGNEIIEKVKDTYEDVREFQKMIVSLMTSEGILKIPLKHLDRLFFSLNGWMTFLMDAEKNYDQVKDGNNKDAYTAFITLTSSLAASHKNTVALIKNEIEQRMQHQVELLKQGKEVNEKNLKEIELSISKFKPFFSLVGQDELQLFFQEIKLYPEFNTSLQTIDVALRKKRNQIEKSLKNHEEKNLNVGILEAYFQELSEDYIGVLDELKKKLGVKSIKQAQKKRKKLGELSQLILEKAEMLHRQILNKEAQIQKAIKKKIDQFNERILEISSYLDNFNQVKFYQEEYYQSALEKLVEYINFIIQFEGKEAGFPEKIRERLIIYQDNKLSKLLEKLKTQKDKVQQKIELIEQQKKAKEVWKKLSQEIKKKIKDYKKEKGDRVGKKLTEYLGLFRKEILFFIEHIAYLKKTYSKLGIDKKQCNALDSVLGQQKKFLEKLDHDIRKQQKDEKGYSIYPAAKVQLDDREEYNEKLAIFPFTQELEPRVSKKIDQNIRCVLNNLRAFLCNYEENFILVIRGYSLSHNDFPNIERERDYLPLVYHYENQVTQIVSRVEGLIADNLHIESDKNFKNFNESYQYAKHMFFGFVMGIKNSVKMVYQNDISNVGHDIESFRKKSEIQPSLKNSLQRRINIDQFVLGWMIKVEKEGDFKQELQDELKKLEGYKKKLKMNPVSNNPAGMFYSQGDKAGDKTKTQKKPILAAEF